MVRHPARAASVSARSWSALALPAAGHEGPLRTPSTRCRTSTRRWQAVERPSAPPGRPMRAPERHRRRHGRPGGPRRGRVTAAAAHDRGRWRPARSSPPGAGVQTTPGTAPPPQCVPGMPLRPRPSDRVPAAWCTTSCATELRAGSDRRLRLARPASTRSAGSGGGGRLCSSSSGRLAPRDRSLCLADHADHWRR